MAESVDSSGQSEATFWVPEGDDVFRPTIHAQGPWNPAFQHAGPPAALLVRQIERCSPRQNAVLARISVDILGPIPLAPLHATARVVRPGRSVELLEATLDLENRPLMRALAWRIRTLEQPLAIPDEPLEPAPAFPESESDAILAPEWQCGFLRATEWRYVRGSYTEPGPATVWTRLRYPLVPGETPSPAQRLIAGADSANGVSGALDIRAWQFVPPELTIHMLRPPVGEWICLDAESAVRATGTGLTTARLYDRHGLVGRLAQALFVAPKP